MAVEDADIVAFPFPLPNTHAVQAEEPDATGKQWSDVAVRRKQSVGPMSCLLHEPLETDRRRPSWLIYSKGIQRRSDDTLTGLAPAQELLSNIDGYLLCVPMMSQIATST
jgi:hypothetical protein